MSFLFGGGRPKLSSAEKIASAETEIEMVSDMFARYELRFGLSLPMAVLLGTDWHVD